MSRPARCVILGVFHTCPIKLHNRLVEQKPYYFLQAILGLVRVLRITTQGCSLRLSGVCQCGWELTLRSGQVPVPLPPLQPDTRYQTNLAVLKERAL